MAIIKCPECRKPISDKANICTHCGYAMKGATDEDLARAARISRLKKQNRMQMIIYGSMVVFSAGVLFFYFGRESGSNLYRVLGYFGIALGGLGYLFSRIQSVISKRR